MNGINKVTLIGNLGQTPELKHTSSETPVCNLSVATNRSWTNKDGKQQSDVQWHRIVVWNKQAEACCKFLTKGRQVYIEGRLQTRKWVDKDGEDRYTTEVVAEQVLFLGGPSESHEGAPPPQDSDAPF